jgi:predicted enzyme related to lactoylglutathione lyase
MSNALRDYNTFIRTNLPAGITYDSDRARYVTGNGNYFTSYQKAKWYLDYIVKFGYEVVSGTRVVTRGGDTVVDREGNEIILRGAA